MNAFLLALAVGFAAVAAVVAGVDAARRGRSWLPATVAVGGTTVAASLVALSAESALLSGYATLTGGPVVVASPRELLAVLVGCLLLVALAVLSGYSVVTRYRAV
ncbi:hypothetical protein [Haloarcula marina]|uniref:hypothetical protein n=1 Tax=Haloarcula marina TaxID=2961574 RepID=UPI0020B877D0|nr:hypothetical protein [Halomicroarcula marina]